MCVISMMFFNNKRKIYEQAAIVDNSLFFIDFAFKQNCPNKTFLVIFNILGLYGHTENCV